MTWLRLEAAVFQDAKMIRAGYWGGQVFIAALTMAKLHGFWNGALSKSDFDAALVAHHLNAVTVSNVTQLLEDGIAACVRVGLLIDEPEFYRIAQWSKYQHDPTNAVRQERHRKRKKERNALRNDVTATGRDGTGRDEVTSRTVSSRGVVAASEGGVGGTTAPAPGAPPPSPRTPSPFEQGERPPFSEAEQIAGILQRLNPAPPPTSNVAPDEFERRRTAAIGALNGDPVCPRENDTKSILNGSTGLTPVE